MSHLICLASDAPLPVLPNPHLKLLSVNEALAQGLEVPKSMLEDPELDPDEPETFLWSDICITINPETGEVTPPPEDCWDIWPIECADHLRTELQHLAEVEWGECTPGILKAQCGILNTHSSDCGSGQRLFGRLGGDAFSH